MLGYQNTFLLYFELGVSRKEIENGISPVRSAGSFFRAGNARVRVWGYGTTDPLEEVLAEDYFRVANVVLLPGELIYVSTGLSGEADGPELNGVRLALVMVRCGERGTASVGLVQDFGGPDDPSATSAAPQPVTPVKRGRGRPRGSRTRKPRDSSPDGPIL